jgi:hypothetical protein
MECATPCITPFVRQILFHVAEPMHNEINSRKRAEPHLNHAGEKGGIFLKQEIACFWVEDQPKKDDRRRNLTEAIVDKERGSETNIARTQLSGLQPLG